MDLDTDPDAEPVYWRTSGFAEEGEFSDPDPDLTTADTDQAVSEEQTYLETVRGIRSFMSWTRITEMDNSSSSADDNLFQAPKQQPLGQISVKLPTDEWLCRKMDKLNITLEEGYPSRALEASGLQKDQFVKVCRSQAKWYRLHPSTDKPSGEVSLSSSILVTVESHALQVRPLQHQHRVRLAKIH